MTALALTRDGNYLMHGKQYSPATIVAALNPLLTEARRNKLEQVLKNRSNHFIPVLENIHDVGNINAVMRSAEILGFNRMANIPSNKFKKSSRITSGADKWIDMETYKDTDECIDNLKKRGYRICATALRNDAVSFNDLDLTIPRAFVFGNEKHGVSERMLELADEAVIIPTVGFTESFNISVAAAIVMSKLRDFVANHGDVYLIEQEQKIQAYARQLLLQFKYKTVCAQLEGQSPV